MPSNGIKIDWPFEGIGFLGKIFIVRIFNNVLETNSFEEMNIRKEQIRC